MIRSELFVGWIPNVAGRLSFSHIGMSSYPRRCRVENTGGPYGRRVAVAQERRLSDWLLPNWYFRALYGFSADWHFVFVARTVGDPFDHIARLEGEVMVFDKVDWRRYADSADGEPTAPCEVFDSEVMPWASEPRAMAAADTLPESALARLRESALFSFAVGVRRSGVVWLRSLAFASDLAFADDYASGAHAPTASEILHLANQVFFFLKDISHNHRHHHPGSDTITEVSRVDHRRTWAIATHYRIHRKVVEMRRSTDPEAFYGASGMLAYLSSLRKAVSTRAQKDQSRGPLSYNNAEIESSIKAETEVMRWRQAQTNITKTALPALALALVALTGYEPGTLGGTLREAARIFYGAHHFYSVGLLALMAFVAPFYYQIWHIHRAAPIVYAKRILVTRAVAAHGIFWLLVSAFMFCTAALLLALSAVFAQPWAWWARQHGQELSWILVSGAAGLSLLLIYALPFWPTRHDARRAFKHWWAGLRSRF